MKQTSVPTYKPLNAFNSAFRATSAAKVLVVGQESYDFEVRLGQGAEAIDVLTTTRSTNAIAQQLIPRLTQSPTMVTNGFDLAGLHAYFNYNYARARATIRSVNLEYDNIHVPQNILYPSITFGLHAHKADKLKCGILTLLNLYSGASHHIAHKIISFLGRLKQPIHDCYLGFMLSRHNFKGIRFCVACPKPFIGNHLLQLLGKPWQGSPVFTHGLLLERLAYSTLMHFNLSEDQTIEQIGIEFNFNYPGDDKAHQQTAISEALQLLISLALCTEAKSQAITGAQGWAPKGTITPVLLNNKDGNQYYMLWAISSIKLIFSKTGIKLAKAYLRTIL